MRLKRTLAVAAAASFAMAGVAGADTRLTVEERLVFALPDIAPTDTTREYTLWQQADRVARVDANGRIVTRLDRGESYFINDAERTVDVISFDGLPAELENAPPVRHTGETRRIGAWDTERYETTIELAPGEAATLILWISDIGVDLEAYRAFSRSMGSNDGVFAAIAALPGYPVMTEMDAGFMQGTTTLLAVSEESPPAGVYDIPPGYERRE